MRYIYLHGFASSPRSRKATAFERAFAARHHQLEIPDLDGGAFEKLTISGQLRILEELVADEQCTLVGSSMGGYLAAVYAAGHSSVERLVLLAPAFGLAARWAELVGPEKMAEWRRTGELPLFHYGTQTLREVHYELVRDSQLYPDFPATQQPALIFHGISDVVVPVSLSRVFAAGHPEAQLRELDSDHELLNVLDTVLLQAVPFALDQLP